MSKFDLSKTKSPLKINFIVHSTSLDNEKGLVSGQYNSYLSNKGVKEAMELGDKLKTIDNEWGRLFSSRMSRAIDTARLAFKSKKLKRDERLSEINYGIKTHTSKTEIMKNRIEHVATPYPGGESFIDVQVRLMQFLFEYQHEEIITIVSHQAVQLVLEVICNKKTWDEVFDEDWRTYSPPKWQEYWEYYHRY